MQRMTRLDGLRGVLAVYVMLGHAAPFVAAPGWLRGVVHHGEAAVDLFFCLSGLVVVQSLERFGFAAGPFLRARARRLLPVYFVVLAGSVLLLAAGSPLPAMPWVKAGSLAWGFWGPGPPDKFAWHLLAHVTLTQGVIPQGVLPWAFVTLLGPAWSLSTEWQFYGLAAALRLRNLGALALLLLGMALVYRLVAGELPAYWQFSRAFLPDAAGYFALGVASAVWLRGEGGHVFTVVFAAVCGLGFFSGEMEKVFIPVVWGVMMAGERWPARTSALVGRVMGYGSRPLRGREANPSYGARLLIWLGAVSYPLYLVNEPVQRGCAMIVAPLVHGSLEVFTAVWGPLAVALPVVVAAWVHKLVEVPGLHWQSAGTAAPGAARRIL